MSDQLKCCISSHEIYTFTFACTWKKLNGEAHYTMTRQLFAFIQFNGDNRSFCNQNCPYCYGRDIRTGDHYWNGRIDLWEEGLERLNRDIYGVFSYGECMGSKGFYE